MRSVLMMLGVVLHAAAIYAVSADWVISDPVKNNTLNWIWRLIAQFRMPCFFIISGFFCYVTLQRYGTKKFLNIRLPRIIIPLITTALLFNSLQNFIVFHLYSEIPFQLSLSQYLMDGYWVSHLWFLNCLVIYFLIAATGYYLIAKHTLYLYEKITNKLPWVRGGAYLLIVPLGTISLNMLSYRIDSIIDTSGFFLNIHEIFYFGGFFFFGYLMAFNRNLFNEFSLFYLWVPVAVIMAFIGGIYLEEQNDIFSKILNRYSLAFLPWGFAVMCFAFFRKFFDKPSKGFNYLADASYSIYLFHHFFVVIFGLIFLVVDWHTYVKFSLVVVLSMSLSLLLHHYVVSRFTLMSWLFNGKSLKYKNLKVILPTSYAFQIDQNETNKSFRSENDRKNYADKTPVTKTLKAEETKI